ncbi:MAG TPA: ABC transporter permease [Bryobacteraceae bacterium]|nr:ABC transporter permease [Bryobacteraceae bacterium]
MLVLTKILNSLFPRKLDDDVRQEIETHLDLLEEEGRNTGLNPQDARAEARRRFGSSSKYVESTREVSLSIWAGELGQDMRFAVRQMHKNPGFNAIAILVIGLGISAVTTIFSLVEAVLIHSLPYGHPERLVYIWTPNPRLGASIPQEIAPSFPDFYAWQRTSRSFASLSMVRQRMLNLVNGGTVKRIGGAFVTGSFFTTLEAKPELGRTINQEDDKRGYGNVAVISNALWREQFSGDPGAIGKTLTFNREKYTVIGVMPKAFGYPFEGDIPLVPPGFQRTDVWIPLGITTAQKTDRNNFDNADAAIGRLRNGVSFQEAQSELSLLEKRLDVLNPVGLMRGWQALVVPLVDTILGPVTRMLWLLLGAVGLVLLIACGDVANLLLARITGRLPEVALRSGLGAGRARLVRQMLTESLLLALLGGAIGIVLTLGAVRILVQLNPGNIPRFEQMSVNSVVLMLAVAISVLSGGLFGLAPVHAALRPDLSELLKTGNKGAVSSSNRLRYALIVSEVALSFVLVAAATLLIRSYLKLEAQSPGFSSSTLTMNLSLDGRYSKAEQRTAFFLRFLGGLCRIPGVINAGAGSDLPLDHSESIGEVEIRGLGQPKDLVDMRWVTPGYFDSLGMHLLAGRSFDEDDMKDITSAVIVNQAFVDAYLRGRNPLVSEVRSGSKASISTRPWASVIGVVGNIKHSTLEGKPRPAYFQPYRPNFDAWNLHFAIKSKLPAGVIISSVRKALHDLDPALALDDIRTMKERVAEASARRRFQMVLLTSFAAIAVFLAMIGIYGVMAYSVRERTSEIGLRMALGASSQQVLLMITRQGLSVVTIGLAIGIGIALVLTRSIRAWLYDVAPNDPLTFVLLPVLILAVAGCACVIPALNASRVDPAITIRNG